MLNIGFVLKLLLTLTKTLSFHHTYSRANPSLQILLPVARTVLVTGMIAVTIGGVSSIAASPLLKIHTFKTSGRTTLTILLFAVSAICALLLFVLSAPLFVHKPRHLP
jgi:hypothetical protein